MKLLICSVLLALPSILGAPVNDDYSYLEIRKARSPLQFPPYYPHYPFQGNCNNGGPPGPPPPPPPRHFGPPPGFFGPPPRHFGPPSGHFGPPSGYPSGGYTVGQSSGGGYQQNSGDQSEKITEGHGGASEQHDAISADTGRGQGHGGQSGPSDNGGVSANANANASANSNGSAQANAVATASADSNASASASSSATANASSYDKKVCILCKLTGPAAA